MRLTMKQRQAVTAVTVQDTRRVFAVAPLSPRLVRAQLDAVLGDVGAQAVNGASVLTTIELFEYIFILIVIGVSCGKRSTKSQNAAAGAGANKDRDNKAGGADADAGAETGSSQVSESDWRKLMEQITILQAQIGAKK